MLKNLPRLLIKPKIPHKIFFLLAVVITVFITILVVFRDDIPTISRAQSLNILLLGVAGEGHAGAQLTDTIIFANVNPQKNKVVLVSIPRDLYLDSLKAKINAIYTLKEEENKGEGLATIKKTVGEILKQPINYVIKIDFTGFAQAIDLAGGLDIEVENSFEDTGYPITGREDDLCGKTFQEAQLIATPTAEIWEIFPCRFEKISFISGKQHMNGVTALKFVRSRNAEGEEGTDFARSKRQQKIMLAFRNKLLEFGTLLNPTRIVGLYNILSTTIETDLVVSRFDDLIGLVRQMKEAEVKSIVLDEPFLVNPPIEQHGLWVLIPRLGPDNFSEIQQFIECEVKTGDCQKPT